MWLRFLARDGRTNVGVPRGPRRPKKSVFLQLRSMIFLISSNLTFCIPHFVFRPSRKAPREISAIKWREITLFLGYLKESQGKCVKQFGIEQWVSCQPLEDQVSHLMRASPDPNYSPTQPLDSNALILYFFRNLQRMRVACYSLIQSWTWLQRIDQPTPT